MHMMEQTPEAEAGSRRPSGHRIENAPLIEYQMFRPEQASSIFDIHFETPFLPTCVPRRNKLIL
jgi:hypothetical protein